MAEKKLSREIDATVQELLEVRKELLHRLSPSKPWLKVSGVAVLCLIGAKITFKLVRSFLSMLWGSKLLIIAIMLLVLSSKHVKKQA
jgi:predicted tellurium resistance membrane protein TerC